MLLRRAASDSRLCLSWRRDRCLVLVNRRRVTASLAFSKRRDQTAPAVAGASGSDKDAKNNARKSEFPERRRQQPRRGSAGAGACRRGATSRSKLARRRIQAVEAVDPRQLEHASTSRLSVALYLRTMPRVSSKRTGGTGCTNAATACAAPIATRRPRRSTPCAECPRPRSRTAASRPRPRCPPYNRSRRAERAPWPLVESSASSRRRQISPGPPSGETAYLPRTRSRSSASDKNNPPSQMPVLQSRDQGRFQS